MLESELAELFLQTGKDHHQAFIETDGEDPDWPQWYAEYLEGRLPKVLGATSLTRTSIEQALTEADGYHREQSDETEWPTVYAQFFINRFGTSATR